MRRLVSESIRHLTEAPLSNKDSAVRTRQVFGALLLISTPILVTYLTLWTVFAPGRSDRLLFGVAFGLVSVICLVLVRTRYYWVAQYVFVGSIFLLATVIAATAGGTLAAYYGVYLVVIILTAWLSGWRAAGVVTVLSILVGLGMGLLMQAGRLPPPIGTPMTAWLTHSLIITIITLFSYALSMRLNGALQHAIAELDERKKLEFALRESEERFRLITSTVSDYTFQTRVAADRSVEPVLLGGAFEVITGYSQTEYVARGGWPSIVHPDDVKQDVEDMARLHENQRVVSEIRIIAKDGAIRWVRVYANPMWDDQANRMIGINGAVQDITERKLAEEALRQSEQRYRAISSIISDYAYAYRVDPDGSYYPDWLTEDSFRRVTGYEKKDIDPAYAIYHPDDGGRARHDVEETVRGNPISGEYRIITQEGEHRWIYIRRQVERDETGRVVRFYGAAQNISEQKRLEAELQQYAAHLEQLVEARTAQLRSTKEQIEIVLNHSTDAIALIQSNGDIKTMNPAFVSMFGDQVSDCIERILWVLADDSHRAAVGNALIRALQEQEPLRVETQILAQDGRERDFDLAFIPVELADESGQNGLLVSAHDITNLKEIERFKARFVQDALHDMATPIMGLTTRLYLLRRAPEKVDEHVRALENQVQHLRNLLADLRMLSQLDRGELTLTPAADDLNRVVRRVFDTYEPVAISKQQTLTLSMDENLPPLLIDGRQIERALVNLISNAVNYTPDGKDIYIQTQLEGDSAVFRVGDQGMGVPPEDLPRIFERFYRTDRARKTQSSGTGLGLAIVKEIVELHKGTVSATSKVGEGSTFTVRLPCSGLL